MQKHIILFLALILPLAAQGAYTLRDGKLVEKVEESKRSVQEYFSSMMRAYDAQDWKWVALHAQNVITHFSNSSFAREALYYLGIAYFELGDYEWANAQFSEYLICQAAPKYFEEAIQYKYQIAEKFRMGKKKHLLGLKTFPKWMPAGSDAITIYDEVIAALPNHDLAANSLYHKAQVQTKSEDYRAAVETYQTLIRRFPKHPLAVESYIGVGEVYLIQSQGEYPDPDLLDLAELNLRKFQTNFPSEEKIAVAKQNFIHMQEVYAEDLYETARFYERTNKWGAAKIYYTKILRKYPDCHLAKQCQKRLQTVEAKLARVKKA